MDNTLDFLDAVFPGADGLWRVLWRREDRTSHSFESNPEAAEWAAGEVDVYVHSALAARPVNGHRRIKNSNAAAIPGCYVDIDVNGGPEGKSGAAPDLEEAMLLARSVIEPTLTVNSGWGVHAWWLFEGGVWRLGSQADRNAAASLLKGWQARLQEQVPWKLDATADLARLLRLPGTFNGKGGLNKPVVVIDADEPGPRWLREALDAEALDVSATAVTPDKLDLSLKLDQNVKPPGKWQALVENEPKWREVWLGTHPEAKALPGRSEVDMKLCHPLVRYGWTNQEITDLLLAGRVLLGESQKDPQYFARTIEKARIRQQGERREDRQQQAAEELAEIAQTAAANGHATVPVERTLRLFNELVGGPEAKELVQYGTATGYRQHTYKMVLADGREFALGPAKELLSIPTFTARYMAGCGHVPKLTGKGIKENWLDAIQALLDTKRTVETTDEADQLLGWLGDYARTAKADKLDTVPKGKPWRDPDRGTLCIYAPHFLSYLRLQRREYIDEPDLRRMMDAADMKRRAVNYPDPSTDSGRNSKSYWCVPLIDLQGSPIHEASSDDD